MIEGNNEASPVTIRRLIDNSEKGLVLMELVYGDKRDWRTCMQAKAVEINVKKEV